MPTLRLRKTVPTDHHLHLILPPDFPAGEVEVTVRSTADEVNTSSLIGEHGKQDLNALFAYLDQLPPSVRSKEEIDRYIADERASWD